MVLDVGYGNSRGRNRTELFGANNARIQPAQISTFRLFPTLSTMLPVLRTSSLLQPTLTRGFASRLGPLPSGLLKPAGSHARQPRFKNESNPRQQQQIVPTYKSHNEDIRAPPKERYTLFAYCSDNNTILTFVDAQFKCITDGRVSSGMLGFKNAGRSGFEAGYQCAVKMIRRIEAEAMKKQIPLYYGGKTQLLAEERMQPGLDIEIVFTGLGQGREALTQAVMSPEGNQVRGLVARLTDRTPLKIGGTRSKKARRL